MIRIAAPEQQTRYRDRKVVSVPDDAVTSAWIRNESDRLAVADGCWFDVARGAFTVWWIERYCKLYEGDWAGEPLILRSGCDELDQQIAADWYSNGGREMSIERAANYTEWVSDGNEPDWQYECTMRIFGWARESERWKRQIRRFTAAQVWIPKKQKKTPTEASWGLYLTCGDGEQGGKVFAGAKDGLQARIQMDHALAMVEQSPELLYECKTNANESSITHQPTRSKFSPLSSSNKQTEKSKEGLNGSLMIDETHVVDRSFIRRVKRMGISRSEPIQAEVSSAGNEPESYGKKRQDQGRSVISGAEVNHRMFVAIYEAPQTLTEEQFAEDPLKWGKMANPAWGHTAHAEEFLEDYNESKQTIAGLADFFMYRLNIWQQVANAWLRGAEWLDCGESWLDSEYAGREVSIGMDLSKTRDMSAMTATFKEDGDILRQKTWLWITQAYLDAHKTKADFEQWQRDGDLFVIPGDTIKQAYLREHFADLSRQFNIRCLVYDKTYAQDFVEWVDEHHRKVVCVEFPQSSAHMEGPIDDFESRIRTNTLVHSNNLCLNWQAGHTNVHQNHKKHRILAKPEQGDFRKIDGMVSSLMSAWGATALKIKSSVYRRRGVLSV